MVGLTDCDYLALEEICSKRVFRNVGLDQISRWGIGGHADILVEPTTIDELRNLRAYINRRGLPSVTIGETTNLLFSDEGLRAIAI